MRKIFLIVVIFLVLFSSEVFAHGAGLPLFFKINGKVPEANVLNTFGLITTFPFSQDLSSEKYLVNQPINFEIDMTLLETVFLPEVLAKTKFHWDFGDGTTGEGIKNSHTYKKIGSYILSITADYQPGTPTQLIETVQLDILPDKNYQTPKAVIKINDQRKEDPSTGTLKFNLNQSLNFNASESIAPSSKIVEYVWDLGDGKTSNDVTFKHRYGNSQSYYSPALQVKDANGFISQAFVFITKADSKPLIDFTAWDGKMFLFVLSGAILLMIIVFIAGLYFRQSISK